MLRPTLIRLGVAAACGGVAIACSRPAAPAAPFDMTQVAERYVKLVLAVGQHDKDYVDAYYGDPAWKPEGDPRPLDVLLAATRSLESELRNEPLPATADELTRLRYNFLGRQLAAVESRLLMLSGQKFPFDEEARRLYDADPPHVPESEFEDALQALERALPGPGPLIDRYTAFRSRFTIPRDRLDRVFRAAIDGCRARTVQHLTLPAGESFTVEYVTGKSWSAYNWYKGHFTSLIQVNTDLPIAIDRAIDLACHEGYPGHHVYNALLEKALVRDRGWLEYSVYPLFSPESLIAEGTANFGIDVAFPGEERTAFERDTLYPLAGLDPKTAAKYAEVRLLVEKLSYAGNEAARQYLDGTIDRAAATTYLMRWGMYPRDRAEQRTRFVDQYRSYVINYNLGRDLVRAFIEKRGGTIDHPDVRWREFGALLSSPRLPGTLN